MSKIKELQDLISSYEIKQAEIEFTKTKIIALKAELFGVTEKERTEEESLENKQVTVTQAIEKYRDELIGAKIKVIKAIHEGVEMVLSDEILYVADVFISNDCINSIETNNDYSEGYRILIDPDIIEIVEIWK